MKILTFFIFFLLFLLQSCSWITDFYVLNSSNNPIVIEFKHFRMPDRNPYLEDLKSQKPELYEILKQQQRPCALTKYIDIGKYPEVCDEMLQNCRILSPEEYKFNKEECAVELTLKSIHAVKLFEICCSYTGVSEEIEPGKKPYPSTEGGNLILTIKSSHGITQYEGRELLKAFKKREKTKYVLEYK